MLGDETGSEKLAVRGAVGPHVAGKRHSVGGENYQRAGAMLRACTAVGLPIVRVRTGRPIVMIGSALHEVCLRLHRIVLRAAIRYRRRHAAKRHQREQQNQHGGLQQSIHNSSRFSGADRSTALIALYVTDCYGGMARHW